MDEFSREAPNIVSGGGLLRVTLIRHDPAHLTDTNRDLMDVFERVLREGGVFEITDTADTTGGSRWVKVSVAGVDVLKAVASLSWRRLLREES